MPKLSHESLVHLVRAAPELILGLLQRQLGFDPSAMAQPRITAAELVDLNLAEYRADAVITLGPADAPTEAFVLEAQNEIDVRKRRIWPLYITGVRARLCCPVTLVIIALDPQVAAWCAEPIDLGRQRGTILPLVLGPDQIPFITDLDEACRAPELAVLSVAAHGRQPGAEHIALAALAAVRDLDRDRDAFYTDFIYAGLGEIARAALELLMNKANYEYQSDFARKYFSAGKAEGEAKGEARLLLKQLRFKGFTVSPELVARVESCQDLDQLDLWAERVLTAASLEDVFSAGL